MKHVSIIYLILCACLLAACSDDERGEGSDKPREGILLTLSNGSLANTKAPALSSTANLHHVTEVYALLYQMNADGTDGTPKLCKRLPWNPMDSAEYAIDRVQLYQFLLSEESGAKDLPAGTYRVLCVGLDNNLPKSSQRIEGEEYPDPTQYHTSGATYNLPDAIKDKPLSEAIATLAAGKTKEDIAHSELFAGWADFDYTPGTLSEVRVEMKRRVAGVICYLTDIPYSLEGYRVTGVRLRLSQPQSTSIPLCRPADPTAADFGLVPSEADDEDDSDILAKHSFYELDPVNEGLKRKDGYSKHPSEILYKIDNTGKPIKPNSILFGAYLLPIEAKENVGTLTVELLGRKMDSDLDSDAIHPDPNEEEELIKSFPALDIERPGSESAYNIYPNYIYQIGRKPTPGLSTDEYPESLKGNRLTLCVKPWQTEEIPVEYPEVPIYATMSFDKEDFILDCMGTPWYEAYDGIYPLGKNEEIEYHKLHVTPSLLRKPWKLVIEDEGLYIRATAKRNPLEEEFVKEYTPTRLDESLDLDLLLTDYVVERDYQHNTPYKGLNIEDDYRTIRMLLYTYNDETMDNSPLYCDTITVRQYNAITVEAKKDAKDKSEHVHKCAFARYDFGSQLYPDGRYESTYKRKYGYEDMTSWNVYGATSDRHDYWGEKNYNEAVEQSKKTLGKPEEFKESAIRHSVRKRIVVDKSSQEGAFKLARLEKPYWYLPAFYEIRSFLTLPQTHGAHVIPWMKLNTGNTNLYWTSTAKFGSQSWNKILAFSFYVTETGSVPTEYTSNRKEALFIRQACELSEVKLD